MAVEAILHCMIKRMEMRDYSFVSIGCTAEAIYRKLACLNYLPHAGDAVRLCPGARVWYRVARLIVTDLGEGNELERAAPRIDFEPIERIGNEKFRDACAMLEADGWSLQGSTEPETECKQEPFTTPSTPTLDSSGSDTPIAKSSSECDVTNKSVGNLSCKVTTPGLPLSSPSISEAYTNSPGEMSKPSSPESESPRS